MTTMLAVEMKKTDLVDWEAPLKEYIETNHGDMVRQDEYMEALKQLQQLREDIRGTEKHDGGRDLLWRYYGQLCSMEARFPIDETNIKIKFPWYDAYKGKKIAECNIHYEKACILFNIGALNAQLGVMQSRTDVDGIKKACDYFKTAAGVFSHLRDNVFVHIRTVKAIDLVPDSLTMLVNLMLAQAQEAVYEKAAKDNMKPTILAKVAAQAVEFYDTTYSLVTAKTMSSNFHKSWPNHVKIRSLYCEAVAQFNVAKVLLENDEYGEEVARLVLAEQAMVEAQKLLKGCPADVVDDVNRLAAQIKQRYTTAKRDNDKAYCQVVPNPEALPPLEKKSLVKPTPVPDIDAVSGKDLFPMIVPLSVHTNASVYSERVAQMLREVTGASDEATAMANSTLMSLNLPAAYQVVDEPTGLTPAIKEQSAVVRTEGGIHMIEELQNTLNSLSSKDAEILHLARAALDTEEEEDNAMQAQFGVRWTRTPSRTLTANVRQEETKYQSTLDTARSSDAIIAKKYQDHRANIALLGGTEADIARSLPQAQASGTRDEGAIQQLDHVVRMLQGLLEERAGITGTLKEIAAHDDIVPKLIASSTVSPEELYEAELAKYVELRAQLQTNLGQQPQLLEAIKSANATFVASRAPDAAQQAREEALTNLSIAFQMYSEIKTNLQEGVQFYTGFQDTLSQYQRKCSDFAFARVTEKADMLRSLQANATGVMPAGGAGTAPSEQRSFDQIPQPSYGGGGGAGYTPAYGAAPDGALPPPVYQQHAPPPQTGYQQQPGYGYGYQGGAPPGTGYQGGAPPGTGYQGGAPPGTGYQGAPPGTGYQGGGGAPPGTRYQGGTAQPPYQPPYQPYGQAPAPTYGGDAPGAPPQGQPYVGQPYNPYGGQPGYPGGRQ